MNCVVYIDAFFCVNSGMNIVMLYLLKKVIKQKSSILRLILAGMLGGFGACLTVIFSGMNPIVKFLFLYVMISAGMVWIAFPHQGLYQLVQNVIKLYLVSFFAGGLLHFLYYNIRTNTYIKERIEQQVYENTSIWFVLGSTVLLIAFLPIFMQIYRKMRRGLHTIYPVDLFYEGRCVSGLGLLDTGNSLKDPITGKPVIITELETVRPLFSCEMQEYIQNYSTMKGTDTWMNQIKLIPYHSLGTNHGFLPALHFEKMNVNRDGMVLKINDILVAIYQGSLSAEKEYQFILHEEYFISNHNFIGRKKHAIKNFNTK